MLDASGIAWFATHTEFYQYNKISQRVVAVCDVHRRTIDGYCGVDNNIKYLKCVFNTEAWWNLLKVNIQSIEYSGLTAI